MAKMDAHKMLPLPHIISSHDIRGWQGIRVIITCNAITVIYYNSSNIKVIVLHDQEK